MNTYQKDDLVYELSLSFIPHIGAVQARILTDHLARQKLSSKQKR